MGVSICSEKSLIDVGGSYRAFNMLRIHIGKLISLEFQYNYEIWLFNWNYNDRQYNEAVEKLNKITNNYQEDWLKHKTFDFFFKSDCEGALNNKSCKLLYELIKDDCYHKHIRYVAYSKNDYDDFKQLLLDCYANIKKLKKENPDCV